jgi:serine/threonine protein kinase
MVNGSRNDGEGDGPLETQVQVKVLEPKENEEEPLDPAEARLLLDEAIAEAHNGFPPLAGDPAAYAEQVKIANAKALERLRNQETVELERVQRETTGELEMVIDLGSLSDEAPETEAEQVEEEEIPKETEESLAFQDWTVIRDVEKNNEEMGYNRIGQYTIKKVLGRGGMGIVFLAESDEPKREVALKVMWPRDLEIKDRIVREALIQANHRHPNMLPISSVGWFVDKRSPSSIGLCMEIPRAKESLLDQSERIQKLSYEGKKDFFKTEVRQIIQGLLQMHKNGVLHRDLKPANILVHEAGQPMIADFGMAVSESAQEIDGTRVGTPVYWSPEQAEGLELDPSSDYFSLGVMLYELMTGNLLTRNKAMKPLENVAYLVSYQTDDEFRQAEQKRFRENMENSQVPKPFIEFVLRLLEPRIEKRLTLETISKRLEQDIYFADNESMTDWLKRTIGRKAMQLKKKVSEGVSELGKKIDRMKETLPLPIDEHAKAETGEEKKPASPPTITQEIKPASPPTISSDGIIDDQGYHQEPTPQRAARQVYDPSLTNYSELTGAQKPVDMDYHIPLGLEDEQVSSFEDEHAYIEDRYHQASRYPVEKNEEGEYMMGKYKIGKKLSGNASRVTYEAEDVKTKRRVQITLLMNTGQEKVDRFIAQNKRHAELAQSDRHHQIVNFYETGLVEKYNSRTGELLLTPFVITESPRRNLQTLQSHFQTPSPQEKMERAIPLMKEMAEAIFSLHEENAVHLNLNPESVAVSDSGRIKVGGFNLMSDLQEAKKKGSHEYTSEYETRYSSEEALFTPTQISIASDWYSYAAVWYEALTGESTAPNILYKAEDRDQEMINQRRMKVLMKNNVPSTMADLLIRLLDYDPQNRYPDEERLQEDIEDVLELSYDDGEMLEREWREKLQRERKKTKRVRVR